MTTIISIVCSLGCCLLSALFFAGLAFVAYRAMTARPTRSSRRRRSSTGVPPPRRPSLRRSPSPSTPPGRPPTPRWRTSPLQRPSTLRQLIRLPSTRARSPIGASLSCRRWQTSRRSRSRPPTPSTKRRWPLSSRRRVPCRCRTLRRLRWHRRHLPRPRYPLLPRVAHPRPRSQRSSPSSPRSRRVPPLPRCRRAPAVRPSSRSTMTTSSSNGPVPFHGVRQDLTPIRLQGDAVRRFCNGMFTNNARDLAIGAHQPSAITDDRGRLLALMDLVCESETSFLMILEGIGRGTFEELYRMHLMIDDIELESLDLSVTVAHGFGRPPTGPHWPSRRGPGEGYECVGPWELPGGPVDPEPHRIAAGVARWPVDASDRQLPHELGLRDTHLHFEKGCYRGQGDHPSRGRDGTGAERARRTAAQRSVRPRDSRVRGREEGRTPGWPCPTPRARTHRPGSRAQRVRRARDGPARRRPARDRPLPSSDAVTPDALLLEVERRLRAAGLTGAQAFDAWVRTVSAWHGLEGHPHPAVASIERPALPGDLLACPTSGSSRMCSRRGMGSTSLPHPSRSCCSADSETFPD